MATVFRLRYIYAGSRLIFVEQPDSDKYGIARSDLALGQALVGFLSPDSKFPGASTEITLSAAAKTQINGSCFAETQGKILMSPSAIGHAYIGRFESVSGGFALNDAAGPLNTEIKQAGAQNKLIISPAAELTNTQTRLADASERILTRHKGKTLVSPVAKFGDSSTGVTFGQKNATFKSASSFGGASTGAAFGESVEGGKIAASAFGGSATDMTMSHTAEAYVEQPIMIPAGEYTGKENIDVSSLDNFTLDINLTYVIGYDDPITRHTYRVNFWAYSNYAGMSAQWGEGEEDFDTLAMIFPGGTTMTVYTNTGTFIVDNNTAVSQSVFDNFYRCFQSV